MRGGCKGARWVAGWVGWGVWLGAAGCVFTPDLSRFPRCDGAVAACPTGSTCLVEEGVCLPDCDGTTSCSSAPSSPDAGGSPGNGGTPDGGGGGMPDGGGTPDGGSGTADGGAGGLVLVAETLDDGVEGTAYAHSFRGQAGQSPYSFAVVGGALPPGLKLSGQGDLSSKPTQAGAYSFTLEVVDAAGQRARRDFLLGVRALLRVSGPGILADFPAAKAYSEQLSATGGTAPYHFELVTPGTPLPAGLVLHESGVVEGTSSGGASTFQVRVTDSAEPPQSDLRSLQLTPSSCTVGTPCPRTRAVPDGRVGQGYSYALQASYNTSSATWTVDSGTALPQGLSLEPSTGVISGTPTQAGSTDFSVTLTNVLDKKNFSLSLRVF